MADIAGGQGMETDGNTNDNDQDGERYSSELEDIRSSFERIVSQAQNASQVVTELPVTCTNTGHEGGKGRKRPRALDHDNNSNSDSGECDDNEESCEPGMFDSGGKHINWAEASSAKVNFALPPQPKCVIFKSPDAMLNKVSPVAIAKALNAVGVG